MNEVKQFDIRDIIGWQVKDTHHWKDQLGRPVIQLRFSFIYAEQDVVLSFQAQNVGVSLGQVGIEMGGLMMSWANIDKNVPLFGEQAKNEEEEKKEEGEQGQEA